MRLLALLLAIFALTACGQETAPTAQQPVSASEAQAYQEKVDREVSSSMVNSMARNWGINKEQAECLLSKHRASQLGRVDSDPEIQAVFEDCGVDPSLAK